MIIQLSLRLVKKKDVLNPWGPVRGSFIPTGAQRALDLAEVRLPLGTSLQGLLVLLIASHDRSARPARITLFPLSICLFLSPSCTGPLFAHCCRSLSLFLISLLSGPYLLLSFILHFSPSLVPFFPLLSLPLSALLSD